MAPEERKELIKEIVAAVQHEQVLSHEEAQWVRMAIHREAQSIELRKAIIEKTLTGLLWSIIAGVGLIFLDYVKNHFGFKP